RSPHAHALIRAIDGSAALKADGVLAVLTGNELAADGVGNLPTDMTRKRRDGSAAFATPRPALARGRARPVGDPVALVVAGAARPRRVRPAYEPIHAPHGDSASARDPHAPRRSGVPRAPEPPARGDRRGRWQLRDAQWHLSRAGARAVGGEATGPAGEVDVEPA